LGFGRVLVLAVGGGSWGFEWGAFDVSLGLVVVVLIGVFLAFGLCGCNYCRTLVFGWDCGLIFVLGLWVFGVLWCFFWVGLFCVCGVVGDA